MSYLSEYGKKNIEVHKHAREFKNTFNHSLLEFWHPLYGFDIVKFDDEITKAPNGKSCSQVLREKFGEKAHRLVQILINL